MFEDVDSSMLALKRVVEGNLIAPRRLEWALYSLDSNFGIVNLHRLLK